MSGRWWSPWALGLVGLGPGAAEAAAPVHGQQQQVVAPMRGPGDQFGASIAVDGDLAVIGAPTRSVGNSSGAGEAYVLARSGDEWVVTGSLAEAGYASKDRGFARETALRGARMLLGAPGYDASRGGAFLYDYDEALGWQLQAVLASPAPEMDGRFASAVGVAGAQVLVGETPKLLPPDDSVTGRVHVFARAQTWMLAHTITPQDSESGDRFGFALAVDGEVAVIGAPGKEGARGAAYVFVRDEGQWTQAQKLVLAGDRENNDYFGAAVAIAGDRALIGAFGRNGQQGAAYVFVRDDDEWTQLQELTAETPEPAEVFGARLGLTAEHALVSGWGHDTVPMVGGRGGGYLFGADDDGYLLLAVLRTEDGVPGDYLGIGAALSQREIFLGAPYDDAPAQPPDLPEAPGAAYVFGLDQEVGEPCAGDEDCGAPSRCCERRCEATITCEVVDATTGDGPGSSGGPPTTGGVEGSSGGAATTLPELEFEPGVAGCACGANAGAAGAAELSAGLWAGLWLLRRRRRGG